MKSESKLEDFLHLRGQSVSVGTAERGLKRKDALVAVRIARQELRAISVGDVYLRAYWDRITQGLK